MAEAIMGLVIERLSSLLMEEVKLMGAVDKGIADIKAELESIQSFLRDADKRVDRDDADNWMKEWVKQVREVAFQIEDVIDEYMLDVAPRPGQRRCSLHKIIRLVKKLKACHQIASEIEELKNSVHEINRRGHEYGLLRTEHSTAGQSTWHDPRVSYLFIEKAELVGIEASIDELVNKLVEGHSKNVVISLVGMGGIGKSTLAKKAIEHQRLIGHFHCSAWITVSQSYNFVQLLKSMIQKFQSSANGTLSLEGIDSMDEHSLIENLRGCLSEKRYIVVFDDVWDANFWEDMDRALPNNHKGNRIIITTRNENVAPSRKKSPFYYITNVQPLSEEKALELFFKKVFQYEGGQCDCPKELKELSRAIVGRCGGVPLAIVTLGGLLATKESSILEWQKFYDNLSSEIASNQRLSAITKILTLSYHDLPFHLKSCYLYFGMFPEDKSIDCKKLIRLWMAEGFIRIRQGKTLEDVGEECLAELIQRSLVQVVSSEVDGVVLECRVHDLLYEIICSRSKELGLHRVIVGNGTNFEGIGRRLSIINHGENNDILESCNFKTRSVVFSANKLPESLSKAMFTSLKLIRVLDFEGSPLDYIPKEVGSLLHLIYLNLRDTKVKMLPSTLSKLQNLQTLDLRDCPLYKPSLKVDGLSKLQCLLVVTSHDTSNYSVNSVKGLNICGSIKRLNAIQRLCNIEVGEDEELMKDLGALTQLRSLGILKLKREHGQLLCTALEKMIRLNFLEVFSSNEEELLDLQSITHPPPYLRLLHLAGRLAKMPDWISKLENLVILWLSWSKFDDDPLQMLHMLPNIQRMILRECYNGEQLHFKKGGFQKLKVLVLIQWNRLKMVTIEEGALHSLEQLQILQLPHLKEVPTGIHHLSNLRTLIFENIKRELALGILPDGGHDYWKVKHVPYVIFGYYSRAGDYVSYNLGDANLLEYLRNGGPNSTSPP